LLLLERKEKKKSKRVDVNTAKLKIETKK